MTAPLAFSETQCGDRVTLFARPRGPAPVRGRAVDRTLELALLACLSKRAANRPRSAAALAALLDESPARNSWSSGDAAAFWAAHIDAEIAGAAPAGPMSGRAVRVRARRGDRSGVPRV